MSSNRNVLLSVDEILGLVTSEGNNDGDVEEHEHEHEHEHENGEDNEKIYQAMAITSPPTPMLSRYNSVGDSSVANSYAAAAAAPTINSRSQTWHATPKMDGSERSSSGESASIVPKSSSDQQPIHGQIQQESTAESMLRRDRQRKDNESIEKRSATPPPSSLSTSSPALESWQMPAALYQSQSANASTTKPSSRFQIFEQSNQQTKSTSKTTAPRRSSDSRFEIFEDKLREEEDINGIIM